MKGYKSYAVALGMVVLSGLMAQDIISAEVGAWLGTLLTGAGVAALRAGIAKTAAER